MEPMTLTAARKHIAAILEASAQAEVNAGMGNGTVLTQTAISFAISGLFTGDVIDDNYLNLSIYQTKGTPTGDYFEAYQSVMQMRAEDKAALTGKPASAFQQRRA